MEAFHGTTWLGLGVVNLGTDLEDWQRFQLAVDHGIGEGDRQVSEACSARPFWLQILPEGCT